jgi:hypothetical protein
MADPKLAPLPADQRQGTTPSSADSTVTSYIRSHEAGAIEVPRHPPPPIGSERAMRLDVESFLEDWTMRHFAISVKLHDVGRMSEGDTERALVLEDLSDVQGILLELHEFSSVEPRVHDLMHESELLQNGVAALYRWLDDVLDSAARLRVTRGKPGFVDISDESFAPILRSLERVHPDLELLLRTESLGIDEDVAKKIALCFRQIGAVVVRVSGRTGTTIPPKG